MIALGRIFKNMKTENNLVAIITDTHFGARGDSQHFLNNQSKFFETVFFPTILERGIKTVFDLGDTFDRRKYLNFKTLSVVKKMWFAKLKEHGIQVISIVGNHQTYYKNTNEINSGDLILSEYDFIDVHYESKEIEFSGKKILLVPWINVENRERTLETIKNSNADLLFGHLEINGYDVMPGIKFNNPSKGLDPNTLYKFDRVFSGHFHQKQQKQNVTYLGCPYELTFADCKVKKGFHLYDFTEDKLEFIENPHKMHHIIEYDDSLLDAKSKYSNWDTTNYSDTYVKVRVLEKNDAYLYDKFIDLLEAASPIKVIIQDQIVSSNSKNLKIESQDTMSILDSYIDENYTDTKDNRALKSLLKTLYLEAINDDIVI